VHWKVLRNATILIGSIYPQVAVSADADQWVAPKNMTALAEIVGKWRSVLDPKSVLTIEHGRKTDIYGKKTISTARVSIREGCGIPGKAKKAEGAYLVEIDSGHCWYTIRVTAERLDLSYTARGNTLSYTRVGSD
jgi:hypothetical protein